jgi:hypothetical protein
MALPVMMGCGVRKMKYVVLETVEALPGIVLPQVTSVMMGCVMILAIAVSLNLKQAPVKMGCIVPLMINARVVAV